MTLRPTRFRRVLLAWEHGQNFGHLARLRAIAGHLGKLGIEVAWAAPPQALGAVAEQAAGDWLAVSPRLAEPPSSDARQGMAAQSFADVLQSLGFGEEARLRGAIRRWLSIFEQARADAVVLDYAPAAQLAALCAGLPAAQITNGFDAPPASCPLFGITARGAMLERRNARRLEHLDDVIHRTARSFGRPSGEALESLLRYPVRWYDCISEGDPYGPRADVAHVGPIGSMPNAESIDWPAGPGSAPRVFVYLREAACVTATLEGLEHARARVVCVWPDASEEALARVRKAGCAVVTHAVEPRSLLRECDAVINYGSAAFVNMALLAGKPQLMLPTDAEKWLIAHRVAKQNLGCVSAWPFSAEALATGIERVLDKRAESRLATLDTAQYRYLGDQLPIELAKFLS
jgi:UDP:flavonoid glycosyltransferase YjiC (YdhE family)